MNNISVLMAVVDFVPVVFFFIAAVILQRDLYNKMVKGVFAVFATGSIMVFVGGFYKALWKILYALSICDYSVIKETFFPFQATGFILSFLALIAMLMQYRKKKIKLMSIAAVPVYSSNLPFILGQTIGCAGVQWCMVAISEKRKNPLAGALFIISFLFMLGMGYLSAKFDSSSEMHWIAQLVNIMTWGTFLLGVLSLHKDGLKEAKDLYN